MAIERELSKLEKSAVKLTFTIKNDELRLRYSKFSGEIAKSVALPGFRKGKAPVSVLERKLGNTFKEDILNKIISDTVLAAFEEPDFPYFDKPLPYSDPHIDGEPKLDLDTDLVFSVIYDVSPQLKLEKWEGFEVEVDEAKVTGADIDRELEKVRDRNAAVIEKEEGEPAKKGDILDIDYAELTDSGEEVKDSVRKNYIWALGSDYNIYKIDDEITGKKSGETFEIKKSYPANYDNPEFAGKTINLRVKINSIKEKQLPKLDDDLAQDVDEKYKTLDDLKKGLRENLSKRLEETIKNKKINAVLDKIIEANPVEIPESLIAYHLAEKMQRFARMYQIPDSQIGNFFNESSPMVEMWRPEAIKSIHTGLIVSKIIVNEKIEASDAEIEDYFKKQAEEQGEEIETVKKYYEGNDGESYVKQSIKQQKVTELLLSKNTIKKGKTVNFLDIIPENK